MVAQPEVQANNWNVVARLKSGKFNEEEFLKALVSCCDEEADSPDAPPVLALQEESDDEVLEAEDQEDFPDAEQLETLAQAEEAPFTAGRARSKTQRLEKSTKEAGRRSQTTKDLQKSKTVEKRELAEYRVRARADFLACFQRWFKFKDDITDVHSLGWGHGPSSSFSSVARCSDRTLRQLENLLSPAYFDTEEQQRDPELQGRRRTEKAQFRIIKTFVDGVPAHQRADLTQPARGDQEPKLVARKSQVRPGTTLSCGSSEGSHSFKSEASEKTGTSDFQADSQPYDHLKAKVVYRDQAARYQQHLKKCSAMRDSFNRIRKMIKLQSQFLTALDKKKPVAELMPFELYLDDFEAESERISDLIKERKANGEPPLQAKSYFQHLDGRVDRLQADVKGFDAKLKKYLICFTKPGTEKRIQRHAGRMNLQFVGIDSDSGLKRKFRRAQHRRQQALILLVMERIIHNDLVVKYPDLEFSDKMRSNILKIVCQRIDLKNYFKQEVMQECIMHIEALYVYATLKSVLLSQQSDPIVQRMIFKYGYTSLTMPRVDEELVIGVLGYKMPTYDKERRDELESCKKHLRRESIPGNLSMSQIVLTLLQKTFRIVQGYPLFELPTELNNETIGYMLSQKEFASLSRD